jgi:hypothetical protein
MRWFDVCAVLLAIALAWHWWSIPEMQQPAPNTWPNGLTARDSVTATYKPGIGWIVVKN